MQCWQPQNLAFEDDDHQRHQMQMEQPLDFSVKSPGSFGGSERDFCSPHDGHRSASRSSKSRGSGGSLIKDDQYWVRREKNNAAAKRSRDARRQKEEQTKHENAILREENEKLKYTVKTLQDHVRSCPHAR